MLTDVQTPFLGTALVPLKVLRNSSRGQRPSAGSGGEPGRAGASARQPGRPEASAPRPSPHGSCCEFPSYLPPSLSLPLSPCLSSPVPFSPDLCYLSSHLPHPQESNRPSRRDADVSLRAVPRRAPAVVSRLSRTTTCVYMSVCIYIYI